MNIKTRIFSLIVVAISCLFGGVQQAKADVNFLTSANKWVKLDAMPQADDWDKYYYVIVDVEKPLMLKLAYGTEERQGTDHLAMWYQQPVDPYTDQSALWTFEKSTYSNSHSRYYEVIRNVAVNEILCSDAGTPAYFRTGVTTDPTALAARVDIQPVKASNGTFRYFYIGNGNTGGLENHEVKVYLGPWATDVDHLDVPARTETSFNIGNNNKGRFYIYAILKTDYKAEQAKRLSEVATMENPQNVSWFIKDPGFEMESGTALSSYWTNNGGTDPKIGGIAENHIFRYNGAVGVLKQTVTGLPAGKYKVRVQSFVREGDTKSCYDKYMAKTLKHTSVVYAGTETAPVMTIFAYDKTEADTDNGFNYKSTSGKTGNYYIPNESENLAKALNGNYFKAGKLTKFGDMMFNEVDITLSEEENTLDIGIKATQDVTDTYFPVDNFELWFCGPVPVVEKEPEIVNVTANIENETIKQYIAKASYEYLGVVDPINSDQPRADKPAPISIPVSLTGDLKVSISESEDYSNPFTYTGQATNGNLTFYFNGVPGVKYYYKVENDKNKVRYKGTLDITAPIRMIYTQNGSNIRDLGGRINVDGKMVKYGRIFRGGELKGQQTNMTADDIKEMQRLGITAELDLRSQGQINSQSAAITPGAERLFMNIDESGSGLITNPVFKTTVQQSIHFIADNLKKKGNVYFHCIWGADRTGAFAMFLECILGYQLPDILRDYQLTSFSKAGRRPQVNGLNLVGKLIAVQDAKDSNGNPLYAGKNIQEKMVSFIKSCGVTDEDINTIRTELLEDTPASQAAFAQTLNAHYNKFAQAAGLTFDATATTKAGVNAKMVDAIAASSTGSENTLDLTALLVNAGFESGSDAENWLRRGNTDGFSNGGTSSNKIARYLNNPSASIRKTLHDMPAGTYIVKCQGFDRKEGDPTAEKYANFLSGSAVSSSYLMANDVKVPLRSLYEDAQNNSYGSNSGEYNPATSVYVPGGTNSCAGAFESNNRSLYWNVAVVTIPEQGDINLGIVVDGSTPDYTVFDNFKLYYLKSVPEYTMNIGATSTVLPSEDLYCNFRSDCTLDADMWNGICLPYDVPADKLDAMGFDKVYRLSSQTPTTANGEVTIYFDEVTTGIKAGMAYVVKAKEGKTSINADNVIVRAKRPMEVKYADDQKMNGVYHNTGKDNRYYIENNKLCKGEGNHIIKGFHAYITAPTGTEKTNIEGLGDVTTLLNRAEAETPNAIIYDINGRMLLKMQRGINIVNGKKVLSK